MHMLDQSFPSHLPIRTHEILSHIFIEFGSASYQLLFIYQPSRHFGVPRFQLSHWLPARGNALTGHEHDHHGFQGQALSVLCRAHTNSPLKAALSLHNSLLVVMTYLVLPTGSSALQNVLGESLWILRTKELRVVWKTYIHQTVDRRQDIVVMSFRDVKWCVLNAVAVDLANIQVLSHFGDFGPRYTICSTPSPWWSRGVLQQGQGRSTREQYEHI